MRFRILPLIMFVAFTSVVVKVFDVIEEKANISDGALVSKIEALAQDSTKPAAAPAATTPPTPTATPPATTAAKPTAPAAPAATPSATPNDKTAIPSASDAAGADGKAETNAENGATLSPGYSGAGPKELEVTNMSDMEKNLLENLAKRRKELEDWSASIAMKENILNATEKKINSKMEDLKKLEDEVKVLLEQYNQKEDEKTKRLVKIYESMKPADAASIFEKMDTDVLLNIASHMKEDKAGKILAKMDPTKAKDVTDRLAKDHVLPVN